MIQQEFMNAVREIIAQNTRIIKACKLPNTVMRDFIKNEDKVLSLANLQRIAAATGLSLDIRFTDETGREVSKKELEERLNAIVPPSRAKSKTRDTEALIAGVVPVEDSEDISEVTTTDTSQHDRVEEVKEVKTVHEKPKQTVKKADDFEIDFTDIFKD